MGMVSHMQALATPSPQEQAAKTNMLSVVSIQVFILCAVGEGVANACI